MSSEENLIMHYEDHISFKTLVYEKSGLGVYAKLAVSTAI
jgi:hypothetical protein